jgi:hypothetical protein
MANQFSVPGTETQIACARPIADREDDLARNVAVRRLFEIILSVPTTHPCLLRGVTARRRGVEWSLPAT